MPGKENREWAYEKYSIFGKSVDDMCPSIGSTSNF
jgi:hypothetical protein